MDFDTILFWSMVPAYVIWVIALTKDFLFDENKKWYYAFLIPFEPLFVWYISSRIDGMTMYLERKKWLKETKKEK